MATAIAATVTVAIVTIQNPAAYLPATELVTVSRQGNERENEIVSNQTTFVDRFARIYTPAVVVLAVLVTLGFAAVPLAAALGFFQPDVITAPHMPEAMVKPTTA